MYGNVVSVTPPAVTSWSEAKQRLWVKTEEGREISVPVPTSVEARQGHEVELVVSTGSIRGKEKSQWCAVRNRTTGQWNQIDRFPPCEVYNGWTNFWGGAFQGGSRSSGPVAGLLGIVIMMAVVLGIPLAILPEVGFRWLGILDPFRNFGVFAGFTIVVTATTLIFARRQSSNAVSGYRAAIAAYVGAM